MDRLFNILLNPLRESIYNRKEKLPESFYAKKTVNLGFFYEKIGACPNDCMLYVEKIDACLNAVTMICLSLIKIR